MTTVFKPFGVEKEIKMISLFKRGNKSTLQSLSYFFKTDPEMLSISHLLKYLYSWQILDVLKINQQKLNLI
jgi:hypothetical protein